MLICSVRLVTTRRLHLRRQDFYVRRDVRKMRWIARYDAFDPFAASERRVQRVIDAAAHDAAAPRLPDRGLIISYCERLNVKFLAQPEGQLSGKFSGHFVKASEGSKRFRKCVCIGKTVPVLLERREASPVFWMF